MDIEDDEIVDPTLDPSGGEPQSHKGADKGKKDEPIDPKAFKSLQDEVAQLRRERDEARESERYWADKARGGRQQEEEEPEPEPEDNDDPEVEDDKPEKLVNDLTASGKEALKRRGFTTKKEVRELVRKEAEKIARGIATEVVERKAAKLTSDAEIMTKYPELKDESSPLFSKTREVFRSVVQRNPEKAKDPEALLDAAKEAKYLLRIEELEKGGSESERSRRERIAAQDVSRGRRGSGFEDDDSGSLGPEAQEIIRQLGVGEDDYRASRKQLGMRRVR